jgi:hypothetical protein
MARKIRKITPNLLKEALEQGKVDSEKIDAEETEAEDLAGSIELDIDYMKALQIHEKRLRLKMKQIKEAKNILKKRISKRI